MCWTEGNDDFYWWPCRRGDTQGCFCLHFMFRCECGGSYWLYVKVCLCFFFLLVYFQSPAPLSLIDIVQTLHFKGGTVKSSLRRKVFFCFFFRFYSRCSSLQVPKVAQVGRWKVLEWPQCCWPMRVTRKWISSKDSMKNDISENAAESQAGTAYRMTFPACFQPMGEWLSVEGFSGAHRWKWRWWLNRLKLKPVKRV